MYCPYAEVLFEEILIIIDIDIVEQDLELKCKVSVLTIKISNSKRFKSTLRYSKF